MVLYNFEGLYVFRLGRLIGDGFVYHIGSKLKVELKRQKLGGVFPSTGIDKMQCESSVVLATSLSFSCS